VITGILVALPDEISSLTSKNINKGDCISINDKLLVCCSGAGPVNAKKASQLLIDNGAERLISWGCAAALSPDLQPGDLVLPEELLSEKTEQLSLHSSWLTFIKQQLSELSPLSGSLIESSTIVADCIDKQRIYQKSSAIALDMESIAVATVAKENNMPAVVIRCIADPVDMNLPKSINYAMNNQGDIELPKLLYFLLSHPFELTGLIKLGLHFNKAKNKLKLVKKQLDIIVGFEQKTGDQ